MGRIRRLIGSAAKDTSGLVGRARGALSRGGVEDLNRRVVARMAPRTWPSGKQFKYLGSVLAPRELLAIRIALATFALAVAALGVRLWTEHVVPVPARGGEYVEAVVGAPSLPNPLFASGSDVDGDLARLMYAGLVAETPDGTLVPDLAESFEVSDDGKEYVFRMKDDLKWQDGVPLTVDDVMFTVNLIQTPDYKSPLGQLFRGVTATRVDDRTVKFTLDKPSSGFLNALTVGILPTHIWQDVPPSGFTLADYNLKPVGAGPFEFKSLVRDRLGAVRSYTMERFDGAATPALLDRITFRFYPDMDSAVAAVASRQADGIAFVPLEYRSKVEARHDLAEYDLRLPQSTDIFFDSKNQPLFKDDAVRKALLAATPRQKIVDDVLGGAATLVDSPILPGMPGYDGSLTQAGYDPDAARKLLDDAGYSFATPTSTYRELQKTKKITIGTGKKAQTKTVADGDPVPLHIVLTTVDSQEYRSVADAVASAWRDVGVDVEVKTVAATDMNKDVLKDKSYEALIYGEVLGADRDPYPFWHSSQVGEGGFNLALYANRTVDDALDAARSATSTEARAEDYSTVAKKIVEDVPAIFLYSPSYPYYVEKAVNGVQIGLVTVPADRFAGVRDWYMKLRQAWR